MGYLEPSHASIMKHFVKIVNGFYRLTLFTKTLHDRHFTGLEISIYTNICSRTESISTVVAVVVYSFLSKQILTWKSLDHVSICCLNRKPLERSISPLSPNPAKWPNTFKQFVGVKRLGKRKESISLVFWPY